MLTLLVEAARVHGVAATAAIWQCASRGGARQAEPCRGSRAQAGMERLLDALMRALHAQHAVHAHSPCALATRASWAPL